MERLFAPWRVEYVTQGKAGGCIFCNLARARPGEELVLFSGSLTLVILNKYPYNNGHLMVASKRHEARFEGLSVEESLDILRLLRHSITALKDAFSPDGFNIGLNLGKAAGAGIEDHLHWHVVPRWDGDTNFMPVVSETRVIPEHLLNTLSKLRPYFEKI